MGHPESNGLFEVAGKKQPKERGFNCMQLIKFLTDDGVTKWDDWHGAHEQASVGSCPYTGTCHIHAKSIKKLKKKGVQLKLF